MFNPKLNNYFIRVPIKYPTYLPQDVPFNISFLYHGMTALVITLKLIKLTSYSSEFLIPKQE